MPFFNGSAVPAAPPPMQGPVFGPQPSFQPQPATPLGFQVVNGNAGVSFSPEQVPQQQFQQPVQQGFQPQPQQLGQPQQGWPQPSQQGWPVQQPAPVQQPQSGWGQPAPQQPQGQPQMGLNTRLDGPGIPPSLRGRTIGDAIQLYGALEASWMQGRQAPPTTPAQQSLAQVQGPSPQGLPPQGPSPQGQRASLWTNPEEVIGQLIEQKMGSVLAPVVQHTQQEAITRAYTIARNGIVDFQQLEPDLMQLLAGADPQSLSNPATWSGAADIIRGKQMREGRYQPPQQGVQGVQVQGQPQPGNGAPQFSPHASMVGAQPASPTFGFFTESPSAPSVQLMQGNLPGQPSALDFRYAERFGMPIQDFMAWKHGAGQQPVQQQFQQPVQQPAWGGVR